MKSNVKTIAVLVAILPLSCLTLFGQKKDKDAKGTSKEVETENLVENGGFEATTGKPKKLGSIDLATGWMSPTGARADLYMSASKVPEMAVPENAYGKEEPKEGQNYVGINAYSYGDKIPRTYISAKLKTPLKKGIKYCVSFYVSLAELSKYASNNIGMHIAKKPFGTDAKTSIVEKTHIMHKDNKVFNATYNWEKVCGTYEAEGGEKVITIGNFTNNDLTKNERLKAPKDFKGTQSIMAYYYIDDVVISQLEEGKKCDCGGSDDKQISTTIYSRPPFLKEDMTDKEKIEAQMSFFAQGKTMLQPNVEESLLLISDLMKKNKTIKIEITGYYDQDEKELSKENPLFEDMDLKRVETVERFLMDNGVSKDRIIKKISGMEGENPEIQISDSDDLKKAKTRRVSYRVVN